MKDLQDIINARAEKRAYDEVATFIKAFHLNNIHRLLGEDMVIVGEREDDIRSVFFSITNDIPQRMISSLTEIYIPEESQKFIEEVERLRQTTDELFGEVDNIINNQHG